MPVGTFPGLAVKMKLRIQPLGPITIELRTDAGHASPQLRKIGALVLHRLPRRIAPDSPGYDEENIRYLWEHRQRSISHFMQVAAMRWLRGAGPHICP